MIYKKILYVVLLTSCMFLYAQDNEIDINKYQDIILSITAGLDSIMDNAVYSEIVNNTFIISRNAVNNNEVTFKIDPRLDTVLGGLNFSIFESGEISLVFGHKYLETYFPGSSIHYSILIHEYRHLHDYLTNRTSFIHAKTNDKELYWYEMDALRIEAEFIKFYLAGKYKLTGFEEYILYSFDNNNLNTASIFLKKESWSVFWYFSEMEERFYDDEITKDEVIAGMEQVGNMLIDYFFEDNEDYIKFIRYIEVLTFRKYMIRILPFIIEKPEMTWGEVFLQFPKIAEIYENMSEILNNNDSNQTEYLNSLYKFWEDDILSRQYNH